MLRNIGIFTLLIVLNFAYPTYAAEDNPSTTTGHAEATVVGGLATIQTQDSSNVFGPLVLKCTYDASSKEPSECPQATLYPPTQEDLDIAKAAANRLQPGSGDQLTINDLHVTYRVDF